MGSVCNWQPLSGVILCSGQDAGGAGYVTKWVEYLLAVQEALTFNPSTA